ncbi:MAG: GFA family protein [Pseudomonadota bacterium]
MLTGRCNCGGITFTIHGPPQDGTVCHCGQCRKQSGHVWVSTSLPHEDIAIEGHVRWYDSSPDARRGFCPTCGAFLFWQRHGSGKTSFSLGALDQPTGLGLRRHIFVSDKGDYYQIADDLPQSP